MTYKYEGFKVGDRIRAYDFEPQPDRNDRYLEGLIYKVCPRGTLLYPYAHYGVKVDRDTLFQNERDQAIVPMETPFDFEDRVVLLEEQIDIGDKT